MDPEKLKVVDLRTELSQRGLDTKGVKSVLVERLRKAIEEENASQEDANANAENIHDARENDEKSTDSAKVPQTPKKSSRLAKSTPAVAPREIPAAKKRRTSRVTYSRKRTSPKKADQNDTSREPSPTISESALQEESTIPEETMEQEETLLEEKTDLLEKNNEMDVKKSLSDIGNEGLNSTKVTKADDESKNIDPTKNSERDTNVSQPSIVKSPMKSSETIKLPLKKSDEIKDILQVSITKLPAKCSKIVKSSLEKPEEKKDSVQASVTKPPVKSSEIVKSPLKKSEEKKDDLQASVTAKSPVKSSEIVKSPLKKSEEKKDDLQASVAKSPVKSNEIVKSPLKKPEEKKDDLQASVAKSPVKSNEIVKSPLKKPEEKKDVMQASVTKSPVKSSEIITSPVKTVEEKIEKTDNMDQKQQPVTQMTLQEETSESTEVAKETIKIESNEFQNDTPKATNDKHDRIDDMDKEVVKNEKKNEELADDVQVTEPVNDVKTANIPESKLLMDDSHKEDQNVNENENPQSSLEDQFMEDEEVESSNKPEMEDNIDNKEDDQDIEMIEIKHEEDTDVDMREGTKNDVVKDRKRKRSPSPLGDRHEPPAMLVENEPEIDDSALILSWYDSDLNLVIDEDGFFTATPMHNDGFSHMWAGARASYGFLHGKVYYEAKIVDLCAIDAENKDHPHILRIGWSTLYTSMQLGEEKFSFGYSSTGKKLTDNQFEDYGLQFGKDDVIGCYFDATSESNIILSYTVNGKDQGTAFNISKEELGDKPLFPHILSKNCSFACNFGQEKPWVEEVLQDYVSIGNVDSQYKIPGPRRPGKKEECEVIMMCGLPGCGKTTWAMKHATEHSQKMFNILGLNTLIDKIKDPGSPQKADNNDQWETLINKCTRALDTLLEMAPTRRRNYILDQTNVYPSAQRRKMKNFSGYQRKAVVLVPSEEEFKSRVAKQKLVEGKEPSDSALLEMKANFRAPVSGEFFDVIDWVELDQEEGKKIIGKYNKEGKDAGYGQQQSKRPRLESRPESTRENRNDVRSNRDNRESRDHRDRRGNNYFERNRNLAWRCGNMGWRDRLQRGGHNRHGIVYGLPSTWRGRGAPIPLVHRGMDRRGGNVDRRIGNDRGRATSSRQGGWASMGNFQGSQQFGWNQQSNWSSGQSQGGWGQQNNWGGSQQQWGTWKGYSQGSYSQQNYGNGNWNSWNQQYCNQFWGQQPQQQQQQQQQGGQATTSGQAVNKQ